LEIDPEKAEALYNRACYSSLLGRNGTVASDLKRTFALRPKLREFAARITISTASVTIWKLKRYWRIRGRTSGIKRDRGRSSRVTEVIVDSHALGTDTLSKGVHMTCRDRQNQGQ
jgi:hypothetical protein